MIEYRMREEEQSQAIIDELAAAYRECPDAVDPIVAAGGAIVDGHHRYRAAALAGVEPRVSPLTGGQYALLADAGYDDMEIAAAAHLLHGHDEAADNLSYQFVGADVLGRAYDALAMLA